MPSQNADLVRRMFETFPDLQQRLKEGTLPIGPPMSKDIVWDASDIRLPDAGDGMFRGHGGVRRFWMAWLSAWDDVSFDFELYEAGDTVLAAIDQQNKGSEIAVPLRYAQTWTFEAGEVVHWKLYMDQAAGFEAAGIERQGADPAP